MVGSVWSSKNGKLLETICVMDGLIMALWPSEPYDNIYLGSGNGSLPNGTMPIPESMSTFNQRCSTA